MPTASSTQTLTMARIAPTTTPRAGTNQRLPFTDCRSRNANPQVISFDPRSLDGGRSGAQAVEPVAGAGCGSPGGAVDSPSSWRMEAATQLLLLVLLREDDAGQPGTDEDGHEAGQVGVLVAVEERRLGRAHDLGAVLRVLLGHVRRARIGELQLALGRGRDVLAAVGDGRAHGGRVAGREQGAEDRGHERAAEVALEVGRARGHAHALDGDRAGQRVR